jgi:hypothetical protein
MDLKSFDWWRDNNKKPNQAMAPTWELIYFDAPTRGEQLRLLFKLAKVDFKESRLEFPAGLNQYKRAHIGNMTPLMFDQCPAVAGPDGKWVSQTAACMQYVGKSLSLAPQDDYQNARALALTLGSEELRNTTFYKLLIPGIICKALSIRFCGILCCLIPLIRWWFGTYAIVRTLSEKLSYFDALLCDNGTNYFCGNEPTYADVAIFDCIRETIPLIPLAESERIYNVYPKLKGFMARMEDIPSLKCYLDERGYAVDVLLKKHAMPTQRTNRNDPTPESTLLS